MTVKVRMGEFRHPSIMSFPVIFSTKTKSSLYHPLAPPVLRSRRIIEGWARFLVGNEMLVFSGFFKWSGNPLDLHKSNLFVQVVDFLEAHAPCDDTELVALRSGLIPEITVSEN